LTGSSPSSTPPPNCQKIHSPNRTAKVGWQLKLSERSCQSGSFKKTDLFFTEERSPYLVSTPRVYGGCVFDARVCSKINGVASNRRQCERTLQAAFYLIRPAASINVLNGARFAWRRKNEDDSVAERTPRRRAGSDQGVGGRLLRMATRASFLSARRATGGITSCTTSLKRTRRSYSSDESGRTLNWVV
jgi:hypothetical protein